MLFSINSKFKRYLIYVLALTALFTYIIIHSQAITDFIIVYNQVILITAVVVLLFALFVQRKQTSILLENERLYCEIQKKQEHIDRDLNMAKSIQQGILRKKLPSIKGIKLAVGCVPAREIGGDFYGIHKKDNLLHFFIGDVSGHGISSALAMSLTDGLINEIKSKENSPGKILNATNQSLSIYLNNNINFVTVFYGTLNLKNKVLAYVSAGHHPALLFKKDNFEPQKLSSGGTMLGTFKTSSFSEKTVKLSEGDRLVLFTDGFIECKGKNNQELGEDYFIQLLQKYRNKPANKLKELLYAEIYQKAATVHDDASIVIIDL